MSDNEIIKLINMKELEIRKLQCEVNLLKKQLNKISTNKNELFLTREEKVIWKIGLRNSGRQRTTNNKSIINISSIYL